MTEITLIAALDRDHAIGKDNTLPWQLPDDLKRFKALTLGKPLLMGRKTAQSLGPALPGRRNLVLTRRGQTPFDGMQQVGWVERSDTHHVSNGTSMSMAALNPSCGLNPHSKCASQDE